MRGATSPDAAAASADVEQGVTALRSASSTNHLPAFQRCT